MSGIAPRDPVADARRSKRAFMTLAAVIAATLVVAAAVLVASRQPDLAYNYTLTFTQEGGYPYTLLLPVPADPDVDAACRYLGNATPVREPSAYGEVLRVESTGDMSLVCALETFEPQPLRFSTEGHSSAGRPAVRIFLNASGLARHPVVDLSFREAGQQWTTTRYVQGDLNEGWTAIEVRQVVQPTPPYDIPPTT